MSHLLKRVAAHLPRQFHHELKRHYYAWQIQHGQFRTEEQEFQRLEQFVAPGDWVIDVGANVGHYTAKLSRLVGPSGRVLALEPVPKTFELLAHNVRRLPTANVTLLNLAASDRPTVAGMEVPTGSDGLENGYLAHISEGTSGINILCMPLDALRLPRPVKLVKIDAEGHELPVLRGMSELLKRDRPTLIVEVSRAASADFILKLGYAMERLPGSPNCIFKPR